MSTQDLLTCLFNVIALGFIAIAALDFVGGLMSRKQAPPVSPGQLSIFDLKPEPLRQLPDPWELPAGDVIAQSQKLPQLEQQLLLLTQAKLGTPVVPLLDELLVSVDIDTLQLRPARKIAKTLGIAQKVNSKDQPLSWLRAQIRAKLQQPQELPPEVIETLQELAS